MRLHAHGSPERSAALPRGASAGGHGDPPRGPDKDDAIGKALDGALLRRIFKYVWPYRTLIALSVALLPAAAAIELLQPWLLKKAIDEHISVGRLAGLNKLGVFYLLALLGQRGHGKSTLAAALCLEGAKLFTDDLLALRLVQGRAVADRGSHTVRLRTASVSKLWEQPDPSIGFSCDGRALFRPAHSSQPSIDDWTLVAQTELRAGDFILSVTGGHSFEVLEDVRLIEVKQGPYPGDSYAKRFRE